MKKLYSLLMLLLIGGSVFAAEPNYPAYNGFINDYAGVIDQPTTQKIEALCRALEKKTSAEMAIAVVKTVAPLDPKGYAVKLFEKWKIGKKGKDNGLLILLAMEERRVEIEVGYGLEGVINDAKAGEILDKYVIPFFKQGRFGEGLYNGAAALAEEIVKAAGQEMEPGFAPRDDTFFWVAVIAIILVVILSIFASGLAAGLFGAVFGGMFGFAFLSVVGAIIGAIIGFMLSYIQTPTSRWGGGGWGSWGGGGGFGGFGGGGSGGGGAGRSW